MFLNRRTVIAALVSALGTNSNAGAGQEVPTGPWCWAGNEAGKNRYIPCGLVTGKRREWLVVDLSSSAGIRVLSAGKTVDVPIEEVFAILADESQPTSKLPHR